MRKITSGIIDVDVETGEILFDQRVLGDISERTDVELLEFSYLPQHEPGATFSWRGRTSIWCML